MKWFDSSDRKHKKILALQDRIESLESYRILLRGWSASRLDVYEVDQQLAALRQRLEKLKSAE